MHSNRIIEEFLDNNKGLILNEARKKFGPHFNMDEIISEAWIAARDGYTEKRDQFMKPKGENIFWWYLKKRFDKMQHSITEVPNSNITPENTQENITEADSIDVFNGQNGNGTSNSSDYEEDIISAHPTLSYSTDEKVNYYVCLQSFRDKQISKRIVNSLHVLTHGSINNNNIDNVFSYLNKYYKSTKKSTLRKRIVHDLISELTSIKASLYRGECLNGAKNVVIVCASNAAEASEYLSQYGFIFEFRKYALNKD